MNTKLQGAQRKRGLDKNVIGDIEERDHWENT